MGDIETIFFDSIKSAIGRRLNINFNIYENINMIKYKGGIYSLINFTTFYLMGKKIDIGLRKILYKYYFKSSKQSDYHKKLFMFYNFIKFNEKNRKKIKRHPQYNFTKHILGLFLVNSLKKLNLLKSKNYLLHINEDYLFGVIYSIIFCISIHYMYFSE